MDTKIIMEKFINNIWVETPISTTEFANFRKNPLYRVPLKEDGTDDYDKAYSNFRDEGDSNIFLNDTIDAITNKRFAPSYQAFKKCLIDGELLIILTARGHQPPTIKKTIEYIIDTQLTKEEKITMRKNLLKYYEIFDIEISENCNDNTLLDNYLKHCEYIGVSSPYFKDLVIKEKLCDISDFNPNNTEVSKKIAMSYIVDKLHNYNIDDSIIKIGFSDDDIHNVNSIHYLFRDELKIKNPNTKFYIFDTSPNQDGSKNYNKVRI
jgi:hypothetical protein